MNNYYLDLKSIIVSSVFFTISFSNVEIAMKIITFAFTIGFIIRQWYVFEKKNKKK